MKKAEKEDEEEKEDDYPAILTKEVMATLVEKVYCILCVSRHYRNYIH